MQSLRDISSFSVLLLLLIFIYTLVGLELFANGVKFNKDESKVVSPSDPNGHSPRNNFDDFYHAFLVVIQVLITDNWDDMMLRIARAKGTLAIVYFVSLVVIGVMFFLNIFLAILLENFGVDNQLMNNADG
jgi:Ion transport protein